MDLKKYLTLKDTCDPSVILEEAKKTIESFKKEVEDAINELSAQSLGSFVVTMAALAGQLAYGAAINYVSFAASALIGNVVGGLTSMVGLAISLFNGVHIMLRYLAAKTLADSLETRIQLSEALLSDFIQVIKILQSVEDVDDIGKEMLLKNIKLAHPEVKGAVRKVGSEYSKVKNSGPLGLNTSNPIDSSNLEDAKDNIDEAMKHLTMDSSFSGEMKKYLADLNRKYQLDIKANLRGQLISAAIPHPGVFITYFQEAAKQIKENYSKERGQDVMRSFLIDFLNTPGLNSFFKEYASSRYMDNYTKRIGERLPISTVKLTELAGVDEYLDPVGALEDTVEESLDSVFDYLKLNKNSSENEDYPDDNSTFGGESFEIKLSQTSVLMMEEWLNVIDFEVGGLKVFLKPALNQLQDVNNQMGATLRNEEDYTSNSGRVQLAMEKSQWMTKLGMAKSLVSSSIDSPVSLGQGAPVRPEEINEKFRDSLQIYAQLQRHIRDRITEDGQGEAVILSDEILELAEKHLKDFVLGTTSMLSSNNRQTNLSQLQTMRTLLAEQIGKDKQELSICDEFIRSVDSNPLFSSTIKPAWEALMSSLASSQIGQFLYEDLLKGDLSSVVNSLSTAGYGATKILKVMKCAVPTDEYNDKLAKAISGGDDSKLSKVRNILEETKRTITRLKNKKFLTSKLLEQAQDIT